MTTYLQAAGASLVVASYLLVLKGLWLPRSRRCLVANAIGAGVVAGCAVVDQQWVVVALEGIWAAGSLADLLRTRVVRIATPAEAADTITEQEPVPIAIPRQRRSTE